MRSFKTAIVRAYFVLAWRSVTLLTSDFSSITIEIKMETLSANNTVGQYTYLV